MPWKFASSGLVLAALLLAGCSSTAESSKPAEEPVSSDAGYSRCDAAAAQFAVGKRASAALMEQARVKSGAQIARVLGPNDMVTLEYRSERLNLNTDQGAMITRVNCG
ncbi:MULTISPECIES: I78 family peptidase inhibitor [unclassified Pseudomonas]|uniref:I78 family peptidase inhibitor n=1 Tax=unclassified Pseudomonas TaxID=196821 RepID=UPI0025F7DA4A|nr:MULTISPECIES: I78 family peptidase inhibitor [unclassified Pseudomonas]